MRVRLRLFAIYREKVGRNELEMVVPEKATAREVLAQLVGDYPALAGIAGATMFAIDDEFVPADTTLTEGQQLVLLPPVSGG